MTKQIIFTTDLFKNKQIPPVISQHPLFKNPEKVDKIFPSIGLSNFKEKASIDKCLTDVKKPGTYVFNLLRAISDTAITYSRSAVQLAETQRYLSSKEDRKKLLGSIKNIYTIASSLSSLSQLTNPNTPEVVTNAIILSNNKIELRLYQDILDPNGNILFKKGMPIFRVFGKLREQAIEQKINFPHLDNMLEFKIFSKENIVNKEYQVIFSSNGEDGAWDLITMSMRGIKSCQRWGGDYPRCLIGSVLSKFVGIIYLTSGVQADPIDEWDNLGTKMLRRCMVRYAFDVDDNTPCLILDKMYPELDRDIYALFISNLSSKCKLPIYYGPELTSKLKHIYIPNEKVNMKISARDKSYQDTPLRSKQDFDVQLLKQNQSEIERYTNTFQNNLSVFLASKFDDINGNAGLDPDLIKLINNIKINITFTAFSQLIVQSFLIGFTPPNSISFYDSKVYYKEYLKSLLFQVSNNYLAEISSSNIGVILTQNSSRTIDVNVFIKYITPFILQFIKSQIVNPIFKGV